MSKLSIKARFVFFFILHKAQKVLQRDRTICQVEIFNRQQLIFAHKMREKAIRLLSELSYFFSSSNKAPKTLT